MTVELRKRLRRVGFRFDALAAWLLCQQYKVDLDGMDKIPKDEYINSWVWSAHRSYCMLKYKKPIQYEQMKRFINRLHKSEWDMLLKAMTMVRSESKDDKKKVQPGGNSLSQDGRQG